MLNLKHSALKRIVLVGASTGGPGQIQKIINSLPQLHSTSLIIAQHMAEDFMVSFSKRLQESSNNRITIAKENQTFEAANIYVCEGETKVEILHNDLIFKQKKSSLHSYNPNINTIFNSLVPFSRDIETLCVILTGIGDDGVSACKNLSENGVRCITESQDSAIVDGMPSRARSIISQIEVNNMDDIIKKISEFCQ